MSRPSPHLPIKYKQLEPCNGLTLCHILFPLFNSGFTFELYEVTAGSEMDVLPILFPFAHGVFKISGIISLQT